MASEPILFPFHRLRQRFSFQQGANHPDGKAIAGANGIDDVIHFIAATAPCSPSAVLYQAPSEPVFMMTARTPWLR